MNLKSFLEKFSKTTKREVYICEKTDHILLDIVGFSEVLQNFADKICEAQRTIIKNEVMQFANRKSPSNVVSVIENSGYPKIEAL